MKRMPTLFVGHGSPMMALEHTETTNIFQSIHTKIYKMACTYGTSHFYVSIIFQGKVLTDSACFFSLIKL